MSMHVTSNSTGKSAKELMMTRKSQLDDDRRTYRNHWRDIKDNMIPDHGFYLTDESDKDVYDGERRARLDIIDDTAEKAVQVMAAGLQSGNTSPASPWFKVGLADKDLQEFHSAKVWLDDVTAILHGLFHRTLYNSTYHTYMELGTFGTGAFMLLDDKVETMRTRSLTVGEYSIGLNNALRVDTIVRDFWMTARQMVQEFGLQNVSVACQKAWQSGAYIQRFRVVNFIEPNDGEIKGMLGRIAEDGRLVPSEFRSVYMEVSSDDNKGDNFLRVQPYRTFPVAAPRWHVVANKTYGVSPGMVELGNIQMLNKLQEMDLEAIEKVNAPPLMSSSDSHFINPLPDGISYLEDVTGLKDNLAPLYQINPDIAATSNKIERVQQAIREGFYNNLFLMFAQEGKQMTATEVIERQGEKMIMLGPVIERLNPEMNDIIVERGFDLALRNDMLPPPPEDIAGAEIDIEYTGMLAQAQRALGSRKITQYVQHAGMLAEIVGPQVLDGVNADKALSKFGEDIGIPAEVAQAPETIEMIRAQRQQAAQVQQAAEAAMNVADTAKTMSETGLDQNSALDAMTGRPEAGA